MDRSLRALTEEFEALKKEGIMVSWSRWTTAGVVRREVQGECAEGVATDLRAEVVDRQSLLGVASLGWIGLG